MDILSLLAVIGYTVTIFSIGYTLGKAVCFSIIIIANRHKKSNIVTLNIKAAAA